MASISGNSDEPRDKIRQVQEFLDQEIERVKELKNLLSISEEKVTQLERELAQYKAIIAPPPINSCPPEILSMIFKLSIPEHAEMQHMGRLLLVCKRWHSLIINDPNMWNCIYIVLPRQWDMRSWARSTRSYLELCVERSHAACLHIELDFSILAAIEQQLMERLHMGFFHLSPAAEKAQDSDILYEWLGNLDYYGLEDGECSTSKDCLPEHALHLIRVLTDPEVTRRCGSLAITFPSNTQLIWETWDEIAPYSINLSRLKIIGLTWEDLLESYGHDDEIPSWSVPRLEDLEVKSLIGLDRFLSFDPSSLHKLTVNISFEGEFFSEIARFSQLRSLTLFPVRMSGIQTNPTPSSIISLPRLQELVLSGEFYGLAAVKWELPSLKQVRVDSGWQAYLQPDMPIVQPSEVHWVAESEPHRRQETLRIADKIIRGFLLSYTGSDHFSVTSFLKDNTLKVLNELSREGVLPPRWKIVSFHDTSDDVETMRIDDILSS